MKIQRHFRNLLPALCLSVSVAAWAVPARPGLVETRQPDGTVITVSLHGDEFLHWASTPDGYTLLPDSHGFWTVAEKVGDEVVPSDIRYSGEVSGEAVRTRGIEKGLRPSATDASARRVKSSATQIDGTFPSKGNHKLLMLLINYADTKPTFAQENFNALMNEEGYNGSGSFRDYYLENSYGALDITTTVTRWVTLSSPKSYYGADGAEAMIVEALSLLDSEIDLREFDNDGDGVLDGLSVVHQGTGQEASGNPGEIWSHSGILYGKTMDGIQLRRYTIVPERLNEKITTIGVTCHEFGHNLGAPDLYDTDYGLSGGEYPGTGIWDLMASGAWNGEESGNRPAGTNMWQKIQLGWVVPETLSASCRVENMKGSNFEPVAYRFDTTTSGEYFILENRRKAGTFDQALPGEGLLIYHANDNIVSHNVESNTLNSHYPQAMYIVCAAAGGDPDSDPYSYGPVNSSATPFPGAYSKTSFTDTSLPSAKSFSGRYSYKGLTHIAENGDGTVSFDFICYDMPLAPADLKATVSRGDVTLSWNAPQSEGIVRYNIYRNGAFLASTSETEYTDSSAGNLSEITYSVDSEYDSGLLSPARDISVYIPVNILTALNAETQPGEVALEWNLNTRLTRMKGGAEDFLIKDYAATTVETAHRFRAEDLAVYKGYRLRRISFIPAQSPRELKCGIIVYGVDPVSGAREVLSERTLSETGTGQWNNATLRNAVEITGDKDIWVAVRYTSSTGAVQFLTDYGPAMSGYGNLVSIDGGEWKADDVLPGNFFMYATLTEPTTAESVEAPVIAPVEDPYADTALPLGFAVYRDGVLVGTCGGRRFVDTQVPEGTHVYAVSSLYKGNNESGWMTTEVSVETGGVMTVGGDTPEVTATGENGRIRITGFAGAIEIADMAGRVIAEVRSAGDSSVTVAPGIYLVRTGRSARKVIVH